MSVMRIVLFIEILTFLINKDKFISYCQTVPCKFDTRCQCRQNGKNFGVDCTWKNITKLIRFPPDVTNLNLSHNLIRGLDVKDFQNLIRLYTLEISFNKLSYLKIGVFNDLKRLHFLWLDNNNLTYNYRNFPPGVFKPLVSLTNLSITNNNYPTEWIGPFPDKTIADLLKLETFVLDGYFKGFSIRFGKEFARLTNLKTIILGYCYDFRLNADSFKYTPNLQNILIERALTDIDVSNGTFRHLTKLIKLKISTYLDSSSVPYIAEDLKWTSIEILSLEVGFIHGGKPTNLSLIFNQLVNTTIREIRITDTTSAIRTLMYPNLILPSTLRDLELSNSNIVKFSTNIRFLLKLNLQFNSLGQFLASSTYMTWDTYYSFLEFIDLSHNDIYTLDRNVFYGQYFLKHIDLSFNNLQEITFDLSKLTELKFLDLTHNQINSLNESLMRTMDVLAEKKSLSIDLSNNLLHCNCKELYFLEWMSNSRVKFLNRQEYTCISENHRIITLNPFKSKIHDLQKQCQSYIGLITGVSIVILTGCVSVVGALFYRYRWKIRYMYYLTKGKYSYNVVADDRKYYVYDAFISFSDEDRTFVIENCIKELETERNFRLCIHHRDFLPGQDITVNITNAIHTSRKTVCVISKHFLQSYYGMFEFNMARMESIYSRDGRNILFLIFYEQLQAKDLPLVMLELVQKQSYIEYPNDEQGNIVFWETIKQALGK